MLGVKERRTVVPPALDTQWSTETGGHVISLRWSPGGLMLAAATADGPVFLLDAETGRPRHHLAGHAQGTARADWRPGGDAQGGILASVGMDGRVRLWHGGLGTEMLALEGGAAWVEHVAWSPRGDFLATAAGRQLRLWDFRDPQVPGRLLREFPTQESTIAEIAWKPGAETLLATCGYNGLSFWTPESEERVRHLPWKGSMLTLAWSPDGRYIATGNQDSTIQFWSLATGKELQMWGYHAKIRELAWDKSSRYLASGGSATAVVWDCSGKGPAGTKPLLLDMHSALLSQLAFQSDGTLLASGCGEGLVGVWRPGKEKKPLANLHLGAGISQLAWSPSNKRLAAGTAEGRVSVVRTP